MKYGERLEANVAPEYGSEPYLDYTRLKQIIHELSEIAPSKADTTSRTVSLTTPAQTTTKGIMTTTAEITEETFYKTLDLDIAKVEAFTLSKVTELRTKTTNVEKKISNLSDLTNEIIIDEIKIEVDEIAEEFLRLEKYVNVNFMGFHKILKKHDKHCPNNPCKAFYISRLHSQAWLRGDYSDVVVKLSNIYSTLRNDQAATENKDSSQSFLRSTSKYWVKAEDVSRVKYAILRHLPVFLQKSSTGESDSQFTNSVYLDNNQLELYHGRLDKSPGAIALRLRWYATNEPKLVFVERKTHRDSWTGEVSVKERFIISEEEVEQVMNNTYPIEKKKQEMIKKGKSMKEINDWEQLVNEITQVIQSKQLIPTMRTQCMRTAFQIPFDATVRISLDTNLCMISERGYDTQNGKVWYRDPSKPLQNNEITRFPHAILEIKLELKGDSPGPPQWVIDLQNSGLIYETHKYSKYIHGCAVLLPDDVQSVPYWIDDASIRNSIIASGGQRILVPEDDEVGVGPGANQIYDHLLPFGNVKDDRQATAVGRTAATNPAAGGHGVVVGADDHYHHGDDDDEDNCCNLCCGSNAYYETVMAPTSVQKIEPKQFFANERTFIHWLHAGVIINTIAVGILAFASEEDNAAYGDDDDDDDGNVDDDEEGINNITTKSKKVVGQQKFGLKVNGAHFYAMILLLISLGFCYYALHIFRWRGERIRNRDPTRWDDPRGPIILGSSIVAILSVSFVLKLYQIATYEPEL